MVDIKILKDWIQANPHHGIKLQTFSDDINIIKESSEWETVSVEPSTPLSCILYQIDPMYSFTPVHTRASILREKCTELESSFQTVLKGRKFPIRRTTDAIIASSTGGSSACSILGWQAMARLFEGQIVWFDESQKLLQFYPEKLSEWSIDTPIWFCSCLANQIWNPPKMWSPKSFASWLANKEHSGWRVKYEEVEGTMEELRKIGKEFNNILNIKILKSELQKKLGRAIAIKNISSWAQ
jgi:hypothetical protein